MWFARFPLALIAVAALAATNATAQPAPAADETRKSAPARAETRAEKLDALFAELQAAPDLRSAKILEKRIWSAWLDSGSPTVDLLISRATQAMKSGEHILAMQILDTAIELKPDYAEGWNKRATLHFMMKNYGESIGDIQRTLALEPRHFGAMSGLGMIFTRIGDDESALEIYRRALDVYPQLDGIAKKVEELAEDVEGRGI